LNINGKVIPLVTGHNSIQDSRKKWGGFIKRGRKTKFTIKTLYLFKHVSKICFIQRNHVKQNGVHVHGDLKMDDNFSFATPLLE